jgi:hypothetical protein
MSTLEGGKKMIIIDSNPGSQVDSPVRKGKMGERTTQRHIVTGLVSEGEQRGRTQ